MYIQSVEGLKFKVFSLCTTTKFNIWEKKSLGEKTLLKDENSQTGLLVVIETVIFWIL